MHQEGVEALGDEARGRRQRRGERTAEESLGWRGGVCEISGGERGQRRSH